WVREARDVVDPLEELSGARTRLPERPARRARVSRVEAQLRAFRRATPAEIPGQRREPRDLLLRRVRPGAGAGGLRAEVDDARSGGGEGPDRLPRALRGLEAPAVGERVGREIEDPDELRKGGGEALPRA